jgi:hypothetical protein
VQFFGRKTPHSHRPAAVSYGFALIAAMLAAAITSVVPVLSDIPFALRFLAIAVSAWFGGVYAGVTCTVASLILLNWVVFPPRVAVRQQLENDGEVKVSPGELVQVMANLFLNGIAAQCT